MFSARYAYVCRTCLKDNLTGDLKTTDAAAKTILDVLDQAWAQTHNRPGCTPAAEARTLTHRGKNKPTPDIISAPAACPCGAPMPWHLVAIADKRMSHVCSCRNGYAWASETTMRYQGKRQNPIADFDEAQARKNKTAPAGG